MDQASFSRTFLVSATAHGGLLAVLVLTSLFQGCLTRPRPREIIAYIDLQAGPPASSVDVPDALPDPPKPEAVEPAPEPPKDIPDDIAKAKPKPKPEPKKIEVSKTRVRRDQVTPQPQKSKLKPPTAEEIRRMLASGAPFSGGSARGDPDLAAWYYALVRQAMYDAWVQPGGLSASAGLSVDVEIRVMRDGSITRRQITRRSGHGLMDDSVQRAIDQVSRLRPLPDQFSGPYRDITVTFELAQLL